MIVSRGRGYIFVHIPKTGGTSMALALEARAMADDILIGNTPKALRRKRRLDGLQSAGPLWKHSRLADLEGFVTRDELADFYCFTLVRNPWDRVVSYYHWLREQRFDHPHVALARGRDFDGFVGNPRTARALEAAPYGSFLRDGAGVDRGDLYIRLEHFSRDVAPLEDKLGFGLSLPHANRSARDRDWRGYYTDRTREIVARSCAEDIARFGYSFDGPL